MSNWNLYWLSHLRLTVSRQTGSVITSYSIHYTKLYELGHFGDPRLVPYLAAMLQDADEQLVISAAHSLGKLRTIEAAAHLAGLAKDPRASVRKAAVEALAMVPL